jgi:hypothetical protein
MENNPNDCKTSSPKNQSERNNRGGKRDRMEQKKID